MLRAVSKDGTPCGVASETESMVKRYARHRKRKEAQKSTGNNEIQN